MEKKEKDSENLVASMGDGFNDGFNCVVNK